MLAKAALAGLRVVEYGDMVAAPYAAKLMADLGAEVVKVEPPGGDNSRRRGPFLPGHEGELEYSGLFLYLNTNKKGVQLDLRVSAERADLFALLRDSDVFIHSLGREEAQTLGIGYEAVHAACPNLVYTWITPFGLTGPHAGWQATNLTMIAAGGWASVSPGNSPWPNEPPLAPFGHQADFQAAVHASVATMGALFARRRTQMGQLVEISTQECIAAALELALVTYTYTGRIASRLGIRTSAPMEIMECKDGLIFVMTADPHQWEAFVHMLGDPEWATWEIFADRFQRGQNRDALRPMIEEWLKERTVQEVFDLAGAARLPFAPVSDIHDILDSPQLNARGFFVTARARDGSALRMPGAPYVFSRTPWALRTPAPALGEHNAEVLDRYRSEART